MIARFPFGNSEAPSCTNWLVKTMLEAKAHPNIGEIHHAEIDDTPITMGRNRAFERAKTYKADLLLMIDSDMAPDVGMDPMRPEYAILGARPFFLTALDFMLNHAGPCVVAAPYCGPPPWENVYTFQFARRETNNPNPTDIQVNQFTREEAFARGGFEQCAALPTGLCLIDMRVVKHLRFPYFDYEWEGDGMPCALCGQREPGPRSQKASTEDVYWSRNLRMAGVPQYCLWDAWAGHWKRKLVTKPSLLTADSVIMAYREAIMRGQISTEKLIMVGEGHSDLSAIPSVNGSAAPAVRGDPPASAFLTEDQENEEAKDGGRLVGDGLHATFADSFSASGDDRQTEESMIDHG
jgi:hypothetical protein